MEKRSQDVKEKTQSRHEGFEPKKEHHKHMAREGSVIKPSWRPYDNFTENFTPLNTKCVDILQEKLSYQANTRTYSFQEGQCGARKG